MQITKKENFIIIEDDKNDPKGFSNYLEKYAYDDIKDKNVVIDLLKYGELNLDELLTYLKLSNKHRRRKKSFVIVNDTINIQNVPDELAVVPTLQEASDYIDMEELQREFGLE